MPTLTLTARKIKAIKPTRTRVEYLDDKMPGLALRVTPNGAKSWTVRYRHRGRLRRMTLGDLDVISLAKARERVRDLLHDASKGKDPATEKQAGKRAQTIGDLADVYIEKWAKPRKRSWKADRNLLNQKVLPVAPSGDRGHRPAGRAAARGEHRGGRRADRRQQDGGAVVRCSRSHSTGI